MSNVIVDGTTHNGVLSVRLPLATNDGYATYAEANFQEKTVTENGLVTPDAGYSALSQVIVNVQGSGGIQEASGSITLTEDAAYLKVTGLDFTPKAFRIVPSNTVQQNSSCGGAYIRGTYIFFRTNTNGTNVSPIGSGASADDFTAQADSYTPGYGSSVYVLEHGFALGAYSATFPYRNGMSFDWYAIG